MSEMPDQEPEDEDVSEDKDLAEMAKDDAKSALSGQITEAVAWLGTGIAKLIN